MGGDSTSSLEFGQRLTDALSRFGIAGRVEVVGRMATVIGHGPSVSADVGQLLEQWPTLTEELRQRRVNEVARKLASDRRAQTAGGDGSDDGGIPPWVKTVASGIGIFGALALSLIGYRHWRLAHDAAIVKPVVSDYDAYEAARHARASRVCDATRARVMRGAAVGPSDVEGWVVEFSAIRDGSKPSLVDDPALATFIAKVPGERRSRLRWSTAPTLTAADGPDTSATLLDASLPESGTPIWRGVRIVLSGRYVIPYFDDGERQEYLRLAPAITDALEADYAALYARCEDGTAHYIGAWFRGPSPGGAVTSLVYFMGAFGEHPVVRQTLLVPAGLTAVDRQFAFSAISAVARPLKKTRVMTLIGPEGGAVAGRDDAVSTVTFPFRDANRASRAAHSVARALGIADDP